MALLVVFLIIMVPAVLLGIAFLYRRTVKNYLTNHIFPWFKMSWFNLLAIALLIGALGNHPYSYFQFLRWGVFMAAGYTAYTAYSLKKFFWMSIFIIIAILFNPVSPLYLQKDTWHSIDLIASIIFFMSFFGVSPKIRNKQ